MVPLGLFVFWLLQLPNGEITPHRTDPLSSRCLHILISTIDLLHIDTNLNGILSS